MASILQREPTGWQDRLFPITARPARDGLRSLRACKAELPPRAGAAGERLEQFDGARIARQLGNA